MITLHPVVDGKKVCTACKCNKPVAEFYTVSRNVSGYSATCIACERQRARTYGKARRARNSDPIKAARHARAESERRLHAATIRRADPVVMAWLCRPVEGRA